MRKFRVARLAAAALLLSISVPFASGRPTRPPATSRTTRRRSRRRSRGSSPASTGCRRGGTDVAYTTTAEEIFLKDADGKNTASFFTIAYTKDGVARPEDRPLTFVFNGGPGSASIWLHFGLVGPKLIDIPSDAADPGGPPYKLRDNPTHDLPRHRSRLHRSGRHRLQPRVGEQEERGFLGLRRRRRLGRGVHPHLHHAAQSLELAEVHPRRELRRHPLLAARSAPAGQPQRRPQRRDPDLAGAEHGNAAVHHRRQRPDLRHAPSGARRDRVLPPQASRPVEGPRRRCCARSRSSPATNTSLALFKGDKLAKAEKERIAERCIATPASRRSTSCAAICASTRRASPRSCCATKASRSACSTARYVQDELDHVAEFPDSDPFNAKTGPIYISLLPELSAQRPRRRPATSATSPQNGEANRSGSAPASGTAPSPASSTSPARWRRARRTTRRCASSPPPATTT